MISLREKGKQESRRKLILAARKLFIQRGYHQIGPKDIVKEAGLGYGTFYFNFEDKFECFLVAMEEASHAITEIMDRHLQMDRSASEVIEAMLDDIFDHALAHPGLLKTVLTDLTVLSSANKHKPYVTILAERLEKQIDSWKASNQVSRKFNSRLLGYLIVGLIKQADAFIHKHPQNKSILVGQIADVLANGIQA